MNITEIPLSPDNQYFRIQLADAIYTLSVVWRDEAGWIMDVRDSNGALLLCGVPLITGADLLEQYPQLGIKGTLKVVCDQGGNEPKKNSLGLSSHLVFISE